MINVGDTVKVIGKTTCGGYEEVECIPIGTICRVIGVDEDSNGTYYDIEPINDYRYPYWYAEKDLEKGHMEWVKDK